ncbi:MAG: hypothetical protein AAB074_18685 [Planctomycetota bacterium]
MAWIYDLTVDFEKNERAAKAFADAVSKRLGIFESGTAVQRLHKPTVFRPQDGRGDRVHVSVIPVGVSLELPADKGLEVQDFGDDVPQSIPLALLELLRGNTAFAMAMPGWEAEWLGLEALIEDYEEDIEMGTLHGLVIADRLIPQLAKSRHWKEWAPGYSWLPFPGTEPKRAPKKGKK